MSSGGNEMTNTATQTRQQAARIVLIEIMRDWQCHNFASWLENGVTVEFFLRGKTREWKIELRNEWQKRLARVQS